MIVLVNKKRFGSILLFLLMVVLIVVGILGIGSIKKKVYPLRYEKYVEKYAKEYGLDKYLVYAIIKTESGFDCEDVSRKGAVGLMQIMPSTAGEAAEKMGMKDYNTGMLKEPETNIRIGCYYLNYLIDKYSGDIDTAVAAYNAGHGNVDKWLAYEKKEHLKIEDIPFGETKKYVVKVRETCKKYKKLYG